MWAFLWHFIKTLTLLYVIASYIICYAAFFRTDDERMQEAPMVGKVILFILSPLILADALFVRLVRGSEGQ